MSIQQSFPRWLRCLGLTAWALTGPARAQLESAVTAGSFDLEHCQLFADGAVLSRATPAALASAFGLAPQSTNVWASGHQEAAVRHFRIAFREEITLGTVCTDTYTGPQQRPLQPMHGRFVSILKPDAPYPGDVTREEQWIVLPPGQVKTLAEPARTRALRVTLLFPGESWGATWSSQWNASLLPLLCLATRCYTPLNPDHIVHTGNAKKNQAEAWLCAWHGVRPLVGLAVFQRGKVPLRVAALKPEAGVPPAAATEDQWAALAEVVLAPGLQLVTLPAGTRTQGLRLTGPAAAGNSDAFGTAIPLAPLAPGEQAPSMRQEPPPVAVAYTMPFDGFAAVQLHAPDGRLVRRLLAEEARTAGPVQEGWDLRDEQGAYVAPGRYAWKAIARPPFKLTYELTPNNAGQPPWWAPAPGKGGGGWLGDHGSPNAAAAGGGILWFGTMCAENGHAAIATDLDGNKLWGTHHIAWGFRGPAHIAADAQAGYLEAQDLIMRVVPSQDFAMRQVFTCRQTLELPWHPRGYDTTYGGVAARDGKLYYAVNAPPEDWLRTAFAADALDPAHCLPTVALYKGKGRRAGRGDLNYALSDYDELMRLYAAFLTGKTPEVTPTLAGLDLPSSTQAWFGDAPRSGELAGSVVAVFKQPVQVGSVLVPDAAMQVYALNPRLDPLVVLKPKDDLSLPGAAADLPEGLDDVIEDLDQEQDDGGTWIRLPMSGAKGHPGVAQAPAGGLKVRALRYRARRLPFSQVVTRRFDDAAPAARRIYTEGRDAPAGGWLVTRETGVISRAKPALMALVWPAPRALRGLTFTYPKVGRFFVEAWKGGDADPAAALANADAWEPLGEIAPEGEFNGFFVQEPTCLHLDFGAVRTLRAIRIRAVAATSQGQGGFEGVVAWQPAGDDAPDLPRVLSERISVLAMPPLDDLKSEATIERHIPLAKPGGLAFDTQGRLLAVSDGRLVRVPLDGGEVQEVVARGVLDQPMSLAIDAEGLIYVAEAGPATIGVFDPATGKRLRTIGKGRQQLGAWDPARLDAPRQIAIDARGKLWVADASYQPKRVMRFNRDGTPDKWFLGPTQYGGGGWLDEGDRRLIYYNGMKFMIDWERRDWRLDSLVFRAGDPRSLSGTAMPDRAIYHAGRRYLVGPQYGGHGEKLAVICQERDGVAVPAAAIGPLALWGDVDTRPDLAEAFGALDRTALIFLWCDRNGDGQPQAAEVQTHPMGRCAWAPGEDLTLYTVAEGKGYRLRPSVIQDNGVPLYDFKDLDTFTTFTHGPGARTQSLWGAADGRVFMVGTRLIAPSGKEQLWEYYNPFACHEGYYRSEYGYNRPAGKLNQEHYPIGHVRVGQEEFFITNSDQGDWFCYTGDGMLVGCLFGGPAGYGLRRWTMPEWTPGQVDLSDVRLPQEHYQGCVVKADDGRVYAVAGHNHMSIVRIEGLEQLQRLTGTLEVTPAQLAATRDWEVQRAAARQPAEPMRAMAVSFFAKGAPVDGSLTGWQPEMFVVIEEEWVGGLAGRTRIEHARGTLAYNQTHLFVAARVRDDSPLKNTAETPAFLFKGGDALDVTLGLDPQADPARTAPVAGDVRLLFGLYKGQPVAVLHKPVAPEAPAERHGRFESPVGLTLIDDVRVLPEARVAVETGRDTEGAQFWTLTASVPWKALGVEPPKGGSLLRGDLGVLQSDPNGVQTVSRIYWSGKSQTVVCDLPSETRLIPALWSQLRFVDESVLSGDDEERLAPASLDQMLEGVNLR